MFFAMNKWIQLALSHPDTPEPEPAGLPESSDQGFSEDDLETLRTIFKTTIDEGHALHRCESPEQAKRWADWLNTYLPEDRECFVIRGREVNSYSINQECNSETA